MDIKAINTDQIIQFDAIIHYVQTNRREVAYVCVCMYVFAKKKNHIFVKMFKVSVAGIR